MPIFKTRVAKIGPFGKRPNLKTLESSQENEYPLKYSKHCHEQPLSRPDFEIRGSCATRHSNKTCTILYKYNYTCKRDIKTSMVEV
eukprot:2060660-Amphidinium_carterae.1